MSKLVNSELFVIGWGITSLLYWPVGVVLAIIGIVAGERNGKVYV